MIASGGSLVVTTDAANLKTIENAILQVGVDVTRRVEPRVTIQDQYVNGSGHEQRNRPALSSRMVAAGMRCPLLASTLDLQLWSGK